MNDQRVKKMHLIVTKKYNFLLLLTSGVVENLSLRTAASVVEGQHRQEVCLPTRAVKGTVVAGGVAGFHTAASCLDKGHVAVSMSHGFPR